MDFQDDTHQKWNVTIGMNERRNDRNTIALFYELLSQISLFASQKFPFVIFSQFIFYQ